MGRLSALTVAAACALAACDDKAPPAAPPPPGAQRTDALRAAPPVAAPMPTIGAMPVPSHAASSAPRKALCEGQLDRPGRPLPTKPLSHGQAPGAPVLADAIPTGGGRWTWVNFWAAWCGPCKEEMPRLQAWERKLPGSLQVAFVSLDDDERQFRAFLASQPPGGVRASWWLPDGAVRDAWLSGLHLGSSPSLPAHALVDPAGQVRCVFQGAIEDGDFAQVSALVSRR